MNSPTLPNRRSFIQSTALGAAATVFAPLLAADATGISKSRRSADFLKHKTAQYWG